MKYLTKMSKVYLIWDLECFCRTKLPEFICFRFFVITIIFFHIMVVWRWRIIHTFRLRFMSCEHVNLAMVRNFHQNSIIVNWEGLLPRFPINPHECMFCCTFVKLEADSVCLIQDNLKPLKINIKRWIIGVINSWKIFWKVWFRTKNVAWVSKWPGQGEFHVHLEKAKQAHAKHL